MRLSQRYLTRKPKAQPISIHLSPPRVAKRRGAELFECRYTYPVVPRDGKKMTRMIVIIDRKKLPWKNLTLYPHSMICLIRRETAKTGFKPVPIKSRAPTSSLCLKPLPRAVAKELMSSSLTFALSGENHLIPAP